MVILLESLAPLLLVAGTTTRYGALLAIVLALAFGSLGNVHFSVVMLAGIGAFLAPAQGRSHRPLSRWACLRPIVVGVTAGNWAPYRHRLLAIANYAAVAAAPASRGPIALTGSRAAWGIDDAFAVTPVPFLALLTGFGVNALASCLGLKLDFSLWMFSNPRPDRLDHLVVRRPLCLAAPRYVTRVKMLTPAPSPPAELLDPAMQLHNRLRGRGGARPGVRREFVRKTGVSS